MTTQIIRLLIGGLYSMETLQAQVSHKQAIAESYRNSVGTPLNQDTSACTSKLLPFRNVSTKVQSFLAFGVRVTEALTRLLLPTYKIDEGQLVQHFLSISHLHLCCLCFTLKLLFSSFTQNSFNIIGTLVQDAAIGAMMYARLRSYASTYGDQKLVATLAILLLTEVSDLLSPSHPTMLQVTSADLAVYMAVILASSGLEQVCFAFNLLHASESNSQLGVAGLACALFEDEPPDDMLPGYAILQQQSSDSSFSLLRFNNRLRKILLKQRGAAELDDEEESKSSLGAKLLQELTFLTVVQDSSPSKTSFGSVLRADFEAWSQQRRMKEESEERMPLILRRVFNDSRQSRRASTRSILKYRPTVNYEIVVHKMLGDDSLFFVKLHPVQVCEKKSNATLAPKVRTARSTPKKRVSFENFSGLTALRQEQTDKQAKLSKSRSFEVIVSDIDDCEGESRANDSMVSDSNMFGFEDDVGSSKTLTKFLIQTGGNSLGYPSGQDSNQSSLPDSNQARQTAKSMKVARLGEKNKPNPHNYSKFYDVKAGRQSKNLPVVNRLELLDNNGGGGDDAQSSHRSYMSGVSQGLSFNTLKNKQNNQEGSIVLTNSNSIDSLASSDESVNHDAEILYKLLEREKRKDKLKQSATLRAEHGFEDVRDKTGAKNEEQKQPKVLLHKHKTLKHADLEDRPEERKLRRLMTVSSSQGSIYSRNFLKSETFELPQPTLQPYVSVERQTTIPFSNKRMKKPSARMLPPVQLKIHVPKSRESSSKSSQSSEKSLHSIKFAEEKQGSPVGSSKQPLVQNELQSILKSNSISRMSSALVSEKREASKLVQAQAQIKNNEIFVYKIIHDLRHPTEYLANGLAQLSQDLTTDFQASESNLKLVESKVYCYVGSKRAKRALKSLKKIQNQNLNDSQHKQAGNSQQRRLNESENCSLSKSLSDASMPSKSAEQERDKLIEAAPLPKLIGMQDLQQDRPQDQRLIGAQVFVSEQVVGNQPQLMGSQGLNVPMIVQKSNSERLDREPQIEEEKQAPMVQIRVQDMDNEVGDGEEQKGGESEDTDASVGEEGELTQIEQIASAKMPQKKDFIRPEREVQELVEQRKLQGGEQTKYRTYSLAFERLMMIEQELHVQKGSRPEVISLKNVLHVIDSFKEQSAKLSEPHRSDNNSQMAAAPQQDEKDNQDKSREKPADNCLQCQNCQCLGGDQQKRQENNQENMQQLSLQDVSMSESKGSFFVDHKKNERRILRHAKVLMEERELVVPMLNQLLQSTSRMRDQMENMSGQASMMLMLMRDLMNQAQLANNTFTMVNEYFDCIKLIKQCIKVVQHQAKTKKVRLSGPILNSPADKFYFLKLYSDERRYGQCILNFLSNSIKFTPAGGDVIVLLNVLSVCDDPNQPKIEEAKKVSIFDSVEASLASESEDSESRRQFGEDNDVEERMIEQLVTFQMIFRDTGCGISPENQKKLFMNFGKLQENQDSNKAGVGLGLSICREIILAQGGKVDIKSEVGKGTEFIINLKARCIVDVKQQIQAMRNFEKFGPQPSSLNSGYFQDRIPEVQLSEESSNTSNDSSVDDDSECSEAIREEFAAKIRVQQQEQVNRQGSIQSLYTISEKSSENKADFSHVEQRRCLLANDNSFLLLAYQETLQPQFDIVDIVENGLQALEAVSRQRPSFYQVIVLDISMPLMDGTEACIKIKEYFRQEAAKAFAEPEAANAPLLYALTSETEESAVHKIQQAGFTAIYTVLDQKCIKEMLMNAGLQYKVIKRLPNN